MIAAFPTLNDHFRVYKESGFQIDESQIHKFVQLPDQGYSALD